MGRIVPIYEAIGAISSRMLRRIIYGVLSNFDGDAPDPLPEKLRERHRFPTRREAVLYAHFPPKNENLELLNSFRSPAQMRLIFEEFFYYQLALALRRQKEHRQHGIVMRVREEKIREALKRILPFKPTAAQKRVLGGNRRRPGTCIPHAQVAGGRRGSGKTIVALEAATIVIENGCQVALMAPTEILAAQHFLSARSILEPSGYGVDLIVSGRSARSAMRCWRACRKRRNEAAGWHARADRRSRKIPSAGTRDRGRAAPFRSAAAEAADRKRHRATRTGDDRNAYSAQLGANALWRS